MCEQKFLRCSVCGNLVGVLHSSGNQMICCGKPMEELVANTTDAAQEKHVPVIEIDGDLVTVKVGEAAHPMAEEHYIEWVYIKTTAGGQRYCLKPGLEPKAQFMLHDARVVAAFAYCNLHGLWKKEI